MDKGETVATLEPQPIYFFPHFSANEQEPERPRERERAWLKT